MNEKFPDTMPEHTPTDTTGIVIRTSGLWKGKFAKKGHSFVIVTHKDKKTGAKATMAQEYPSADIDPIQELAIKGEVVKAFRKHFKI